MSAQFPSVSWDTRFLELHERCAAKHRNGETDFNKWYSPEDLAFLKAIGYSEQEFFDFVDDFVRYGEPSPATALLVAAVRRDYFYVIQKGVPSERVVEMDELPAKTDEIDGIPWLPRLIAKARAKLKGEMNPDLMYGCAGDRRFFLEHDIHPADFLRIVWAADQSGNENTILEYVKHRRKLA